jgi:hypothetical protein
MDAISGEDRFVGKPAGVARDWHEEDVQRLRASIVGFPVNLLKQQDRGQKRGAKTASGRRLSYARISSSNRSTVRPAFRIRVRTFLLAVLCGRVPRGLRMPGLRQDDVAATLPPDDEADALECGDGFPARDWEAGTSGGDLDLHVDLPSLDRQG